MNNVERILIFISTILDFIIVVIIGVCIGYADMTDSIFAFWVFIGLEIVYGVRLSIELFDYRTKHRK